MFAHLYFVVSAAFVLVRMGSINFADRFRLWNKSVRLYIVILGFTDLDRPWHQLRRAMISAFISAVYDYDSDWDGGDRNGGNTEFLLSQFVRDPGLREAAMDLFNTDVGRGLSDHGLERGSVALQFYNSMIQSAWMASYTPLQIDDFGRKLQILDDLLDLPYDREAGDKNCFLLKEWEPYARELEEFLCSKFYILLQQHHWSYRKIREKLFKALAKLRSQA